jgi:hypothetical protein
MWSYLEKCPYARGKYGPPRWYGKHLTLQYTTHL